MNTPTPVMQTEVKSGQPREVSKDRASPFALDIIVGLVIAAVVGLSVWYLVWPEPVLVQGEADATRFDIAARVDGRVAEMPVDEGQDVTAGALLVRIDNPETIAKKGQALAAKIAAEAQLANINAGTRAEPGDSERNVAPSLAITIYQESDAALEGTLCRAEVRGNDIFVAVNKDHAFVQDALKARPVNRMALNVMIVDELAREIVEVDGGILIKKIFHRDVAAAIYGIEHNHHRSRIVARRLIDRVRDPVMAA